tara:strand:- start:1019 stop:1744 length:726 start_codon:yes stop_codon:yes gene_type:complete
MNAGTIAMVFVVSLMLFNLTKQMDRREKQVMHDAAQTSFTQLALAQYRYSSQFINDAEPALGLVGFAEDVNVLLTDNHLPQWRDPSGHWSFCSPSTPLPTTNCDPGEMVNGLTIKFEAGSVYAAQQIARRMGNIANVDGTIVKVGFADTADLSLLAHFVKKEGDEMRGALRFAAGIGEAILMNSNNIAGVAKLGAKTIEANNIEAKNIEATETVNAKTIDAVTITATTITADSLLYTTGAP